MGIAFLGEKMKQFETDIEQITGVDIPDYGFPCHGSVVDSFKAYTQNDKIVIASYTNGLIIEPNGNYRTYYTALKNYGYCGDITQNQGTFSPQVMERIKNYISNPSVKPDESW